MHTSRDLRTTFEHLGGREAWEKLKALPPGARVLEIGIGHGSALKELKEQFPHLKIVGTNAHFKPILHRDGKIIFPADKAPKPPHSIRKQIVLASGEKLPIHSNKFDFVYSTFAISYMDAKNRIETVREVHRVLKHGGHARLQTSLFSAEEEALYRQHPEIEVQKSIGLPVLLKITKKTQKLELK